MAACHDDRKEHLLRYYNRQPGLKRVIRADEYHVAFFQLGIDRPFQETVYVYHALVISGIKGAYVLLQLRIINPVYLDVQEPLQHPLADFRLPHNIMLYRRKIKYG